MTRDQLLGKGSWYYFVRRETIRDSWKKIEPALEKAVENAPQRGNVRVTPFARPEVRCHHIGRGRPR